MRILISLVALVLCCSVSAAQPYTLHSVMLLQPESVVGERVQSADKLATYIKAVNGAVTRSLKGATENPASGFIAIAVRPGGASKAWLDFTPALSPRFETRLTAAIEAVAPFAAKGGVVVFALNVTLWGAQQTKRQAPHPAEWVKAVKNAGHPLTFRELINRIWPPAPGT